MASTNHHRDEPSPRPSRSFFPDAAFSSLLRRRKREAEVPVGQQVVCILDNLSTHKTREVEDWLAEHPDWTFVFTPKHASWLNQVEIFFSTLAGRLLRHGAFTDPDDLATQMLAFVEHCNLSAKPFAWTYTGKVLAG